MTKKKKTAIFWFRRDLRLHDNIGLSEALQNEASVLPIFIFDPEILEQLPKNDARVSFIHNTLVDMQGSLEEKHKSGMAIFYNKPIDVYKSLLDEYHITSVYTNGDYEPYAKERDTEIKELLQKKDIPLHSFKDQVIFEKNEVVKDDGDPYLVYTPYMRKWKETFTDEQLKGGLPISSKHFKNLCQDIDFPSVDLKSIGFEASEIKVSNYNISSSVLKNYEDTRNIPSLEDGTSHIGPHLRFGTVSVREAVQKAIKEKNETYWNELIWREFFMQILWHFPETTQNAFKPKYDRIEWRNNKEEFDKWKNGKTGYKLVDAGMRELNTTGYMHNRVRMLTASFLCKHLLIDWRWGEAYLAEKLLDFDLASNVGNWQWAAGTGVDAAPYFRIFNPMTQLDKFDKDKKYVKKWVPEANTEDYAEKMVDHKEARERCLQAYKKALS